MNMRPNYSADSLEEAIIDAQAVLEDCMYFREEQGDEIPAPSRLSDIARPSGGLVQMVVAVMNKVRDDWLNEDSEAVSA